MAQQYPSHELWMVRAWNEQVLQIIAAFLRHQDAAMHAAGLCNHCRNAEGERKDR